MCATVRRVVFGGTRTTRSMLEKKCHALYPPDTHMVALRLRDLYTARGHRRIDELSQRYDHIHYHSASSFFMGTQCHLHGKRIVLEAVPYAKNVQSLVRGVFPQSPTSIPSRAVEWVLDGLSFDDAWYARYLERLARLGERNQVYVVHSKTDPISLFSDATAVLDRMSTAGVCLLDDASHHAYHKHPAYAPFVRSIVAAC